MSKEKHENSRFVAEILALAVAAGSTIFSGWQTYLSRQQFIASEQHWRADRDIQNENRRFELRPLIVPITPGVSAEAKVGQDFEQSKVTIVNLGKGPALSNVTVEWEIEGWGFCVSADKSFLQPGQTAVFESIPFLEFEQVAIKKGKYPDSSVEIGGHVIFRCESGYGEMVETIQHCSATVKYEREVRVVNILFSDREFKVYGRGSEMYAAWDKATKNKTQFDSATPPAPSPVNESAP